MLWVALAAAAGGAGVGASAEYRAYRQCMGAAAETAARIGTTPEDLAAGLRQLCPDERTALADLLRRGAPEGGDGVAARERQLDGATGALLTEMLRRYAIHHATGRWPAG